MRSRWTIRIGWLAVVICAAVPALTGSTPTYAQTKVALVLETSGTSVPTVHPYSEITAGTTVSLPRQASLVFLHYAACRTATPRPTATRSICRTSA